MILRQLFIGVALIALPVSATACAPASDQGKLAKLDTKLVNQDPVMKSALEGQIMVDPRLVEQSNANAVSPGNRPLDGGVPVLRVAKGGDPAYIAMPVGGKLLPAPAPKEMQDEDCKTCGKDPVTAGARAADVAPGKCNARLSYGLDWAKKMPVGFPIYPRSNLKEAAGVEGGPCNVRVVNFQSRAPLKAIVDYYYTQAVKNGYDAEHLTKGKEHYLGGTRGRDNAAYVVILNELTNGMVDVDIVANGG